MSNGICLIAQNNSDTNYIRQAYALALSVLSNSPDTNISLITDDKVPYDVFDKVIPIPWGDMSYNNWKIENRWKVYHATPYTNTIVFDVDMLVLDPIDFIWPNVHELAFTNTVTTYRNELITDKYNDSEQVSEFIENRHDQSLFSLISKKIGAEVLKNETNFQKRQDSQFNYPFLHVRRHSHGVKDKIKYFVFKKKMMSSTHYFQ